MGRNYVAREVTNHWLKKAREIVQQARCGGAKCARKLLLECRTYFLG
jgi:hypothetical protein